MPCPVPVCSQPPTRLAFPLPRHILDLASRLEGAPSRSREFHVE